MTERLCRGNWRALSRMIPTGVRRSRKRIAIVTSQITGPYENSGVGTAYSALACLLANSGHEITVHLAERTPLNDADWTHWVDWYAQRRVRLRRLPALEFELQMPESAALSYRAYSVLRKNEPDLVHFGDLHGLGYFSLLGKKLGHAFKSTTFCTILHGPSLWHKKFNSEQACGPEEVTEYFLEHKSVEMSDVLIAPTTYALEWAVQEGWHLPVRSFVQPYPSGSVAKLPVVSQAKRTGEIEIVFFGRLETRKGLKEFCDAIDLIQTALPESNKVVFLGTMGFVGDVPAASYLAGRVRRWSCRWQLITNYSRDSALRYLHQRNALAVMVSRSETQGLTVTECMHEGVPFLASDIPAFRELIDPRDHSRVLVQPGRKKLAQAILRRIRAGNPRMPIRFRKNAAATAVGWVRWHDLLVPELQPARSRRSDCNRVVVCILHRDRPEYLATCIRSIEAQSLRNFDVILLDNASQTRAAKRLLERLAPRFAARSWEMIRLPKRISPSHARNEAAAHARREFLFFMDDDNVAKPHLLETLLFAALDTRSDIVTCGFDRFSGKRIPKTARRRWIPVGSDLASGLFHNIFGDMCSLIRRKTFISLGGLRGQGNTRHEDSEFFARAVAAGFRLTTVPEALFWYRDHAGGLSRSLPPGQGETLRLRPYRRPIRSLTTLPGWEVCRKKAVAGRLHELHSARLLNLRKITQAMRWLNDQSHFFPNVVWKADNRESLGSISPRGAIAFDPTPSGMLIAVQGTGAALDLPLVAVRAGTRMLIEIRLTGMKPSTIVLRQSAGGVHEQMRAHFPGGSRLIQIPFDPVSLRPKLSLQFMEPPGFLLIRSIAVRTEPGPTERLNVPRFVRSES